MNFEEVYKDYLIYAQKRHKKQGFITLASDFNSNILPYFTGKDIFKLTKLDIINWQNQLIECNYKFSFLSKLYIEFCGFFKYCCDFLNYPINLVREVGNFPKHIEEKKSDFYNLQEFNHFIKYVDNNIYKQFFNFMFYVGTRPGEAMALKFSDLDGDYISISKNLITKGGRNLDTPKNQSSIRKVKIDKKLKKDLLNLKYEYINKYGLNCDYFIFGGLKPLAPTTINRYKLKACELANIRPITLHQFRHSHATLLLQNNIMINEVSRRLGHSKTSTTLDIYAHTDLMQEKRVYHTLNSIRFNFFITLASYFKKINLILKHFNMF